MSKQTMISGIKVAVFLLFSLLLAGTAAFAESSTQGSLQMTLKPSGADSGVLLKSSVVDGKEYFFLPSGVSAEDMQPAFEEGVSYESMQSSQIASVHFFSADPDKKGQEYVDSNKDNKAKGGLFMYDENFDLIYQGDVDALKGRGNTTWGWTNKKSYQIKLEKKADLLDPANGEQKSKKWLLLANPYDPTLMRNEMILRFGREMGLENSPEGRPVDLYYDGIYRGSYFLCEKVEIGDGRVGIDDLEKKIEDANPDVDFEELREVISPNSKGLDMKYEEGITDPEDISGGYLLELDSVYYSEEKSWFKYSSLAGTTIKSPEYASANMAEYISCLFIDMYDYIRNAKDNFKDGEDLPKYLDLDSFARLFLINEWFSNTDVWTSSTYLYKPAGDDIFYAGPLWDFDSTMEIRSPERPYDRWFASQDVQVIGKKLFALPVFREKVREIYKNEMRPVIFDILLGTGSGKYLVPAQAMMDELRDSAAMNYMIWDINDCDGSYFPSESFDSNCDDIMSWMQKRAEWFDAQIMSDSFVPNSISIDKVGTVKVSPDVSKKACKVSFGKAACVRSNPAHKKSGYADDYQISYRRAGTKKWKTVKTGGKRSFLLKGLKAGSSYEIRVRAMADIGSETKHGEYSSVKRVLIRKVTPELKAGKKALTVSWPKVPEAGRYQIRYSTGKSFSKSKYITVKASAAGKRTIRKLKSGKTYYVKMRCYRTVNGKRYYTGWSAAKKIKVR